MRASVLPLAVATAAVFLLALTRQPRPTSPQDLFGQPFEQALQLLGPPERGGGRDLSLAWSWRDSGAGRLTLITYRDVVVHIDRDHSKGEVTPTAMPNEGHYPGQPLEELLRRLGPPSRAQVLPTFAADLRVPVLNAPLPVPIADLALHFGELGVCISGGRVLGPVPAPASLPSNGPR